MINGTGFSKKPLFYTLFLAFILWIILFEFIIPENRFLPKPGIVLLSVHALFADYNLAPDLFTTVSAVYLPSLLAYLFLLIIRRYIFSQNGFFNRLIEIISQLSVFFPAVLLGILLIFWFPYTFITEYIFSFLVSVCWYLIVINKTKMISNKNYLVSFKSLGADDIFISKNIRWNEIKPLILSNLDDFHIHLWSLILIFEFISNRSGLGSILRQTILFHDLSALCLVIFVIAAVISAGYLFLRYIENKFVFWSPE